MTVRCAVIGAGFIGLDHLKAYRQWPDAEVVAVAETDPARASMIAETYGARAYGDYEDLLAKEAVDAVSVCVPTALHLPVTLAAARAGKHVLLEKPMAATVADCSRIIEACRAAGVKLMLGLTHRFHRELLMAKELIEAGRIGEPRLALDFFSCGEEGPWPAWYYSRDLSGGGELMHDAVHLVDRLAWLFGSPIVEVFGRTTTYARGIPGVEDGGVASLTFASGAIAALFVNQATYPLHKDAPGVPLPGRCELEIHGTRGSLRYQTWHALTVETRTESLTVRRERSDEMAREVRAFLDAILEDREPVVGGSEGRRGIAVIQSIYESERRGGPVRVDELFPES